MRKVIGFNLDDVKPPFGYEPEDCPGRPYTKPNQTRFGKPGQIIGCSLCGTQLFLGDHVRASAWTAGLTPPQLPCGAVRSIFVSRVSSRVGHAQPVLPSVEGPVSSSSESVG